jgi:hypothetical protein
MAVLRNFRISDNAFMHVGTLAQLSIGADAPRDLLDNVEQADWPPDGTTLAVVHVVGGKSRLEYPSRACFADLCHGILAECFADGAAHVQFWGEQDFAGIDLWARSLAVSADRSTRFRVLDCEQFGDEFPGQTAVFNGTARAVNG